MTTTTAETRQANRLPANGRCKRIHNSNENFLPDLIFFISVPPSLFSRLPRFVCACCVNSVPCVPPVAHCRPVALFLSTSFWLPRFRCCCSCCYCCCCWRGCCCSFWVSSAWHVACMHRLPHSHTHALTPKYMMMLSLKAVAAWLLPLACSACVCVYFCLRFCFLTNTNSSSLLPAGIEFCF